MLDDQSLHLVDTSMFWAPNSGGVRRYLRAKHQWIERRPWLRQTIITAGYSDADRIGVGGIAIPGAPGYRFPLRRRPAIQRLIEARPDLIEVGDPFLLAWCALDAAQQLAVPCVAFCHTNLSALARRYTGASGERIAARYLRDLYRRFDCVLAPSRATCAMLAALGLGRVEHQPLGVDTERFHPHRRDLRWRADLGISPGERVLIYAGRFSAEKNLGVLVQAVQRLGAPYRLVLVGAGPSAPTPTPARVIQLGFENRVLDLARALASADMFVHAGDQETFGLAALEALASGTPVIAAARGGLGELVDETVGAALERIGADDFAAAVHAQFSRDLPALRAAARERALLYRWESVFDQMFMRYRALLARTRPALAH